MFEPFTDRGDLEELGHHGVAALVKVLRDHRRLLAIFPRGQVMLDILIENSCTSILQWMVQALKAFSLSPVFVVHFVIRQAVAARLVSTSMQLFGFELSVGRKFDRWLREFARWQVIQKHYPLTVVDAVYLLFRSVRFTLPLYCMFSQFCASLG